MSPISPGDVLTQKGPPQSIEAEIAVLGAMILNNDTIGEVIETIDSTAFFRPSNAVIFEAIVDLYLSRHACDLVTLKEELARRGKLEEAGGIDALERMALTVPSAANAPAYATIVKDKAILRSLTHACQRVLREIEDGGEDPERLLEQAQAMIFETAAKRGQKSVAGLGDILRQTFVQIQDFRDRKQRILGLPTGFYALDDIMSGLQKSQFYVIAGRPSMGKTSLAMKIIENVAVVEEKPVLFFSLEMASSQIAQQMLCSHCRIDSHRLRTGMLAEEDYAKLLQGAGKLGQAPILIDDSADLSALEIRARARRLKAEHKIELVVVDYLQKMHAKGAESRQQEISMISSNLKSLAKELEVPVIALAQLNRSPEGREDRKPQLSDLRESGSIEQDADVVCLLYREDYYNPDTERKNICDIIVSKNRMGPTNTVELLFLKEYTRFENLSSQTQS